MLLNCDCKYSEALIWRLHTVHTVGHVTSHAEAWKYFQDHYSMWFLGWSFYSRLIWLKLFVQLLTLHSTAIYPALVTEQKSRLISLVSGLFFLFLPYLILIQITLLNIMSDKWYENEKANMSEIKWLLSVFKMA